MAADFGNKRSSLRFSKKIFTPLGSIYLKNVVGLAQSSIWIYSIPLKHIVMAAHYNGKIPRNPFAMYHVDPDHKEREFLT